VIFTIFLIILPLLLGYLFASICFAGALLKTNNPVEGIKFIRNSVLQDMLIALILYLLFPTGIFSIILFSLLSKHMIILRSDLNKFVDGYYSKKQELKDLFDV
jgi:hypothetical protein